MEKINLYRLQKNVHEMMRRNVRYVFGAKAKFSTPISSIKAIDCSGFVRWLVYHSTDGLQIPDGSWNQRDWLIEQSKRGGIITRQSDYTVVRDKPGGLYLCTMDPEGGKAGHIWWVNDLFTMESHGGQGPNERLWNTPVLRSNVDYVFRWEHEWKS